MRRKIILYYYIIACLVQIEIKSGMTGLGLSTLLEARSGLERIDVGNCCKLC